MSDTLPLAEKDAPSSFSWEEANSPQQAAPAAQGESFGWDEAQTAQPSLLGRVAGAAGRVAHAGWEGLTEGAGEKTTILSPEAQERLDAIQRQGGLKGFGAQLGSTVAEDIGTAGQALAGAATAPFTAFQRATHQLGQEIGTPALGRDVAAMPEAFMGMPHALSTPHPAGVPGSIAQDIQGARKLAGDIRQARQEPTVGPPPQQPATPPSVVPAQPITPEQWAAHDEAQAQQQAPPPQPAAPITQNPAPESGITPTTIPPAEPAKPTRIRTTNEIQREDGVGHNEAVRRQEAEILALSRPITEEERGARAAGITNAGPRRAPQIAPEPPSDIHAQIQAMLDPKSTKDSVFIAAGSPVPADLPPGVAPIARPEGTLLTTNQQKAHAFHLAPAVDDTLMAYVLGYPETKAQATASGSPRVVQAVDPKGNVQAQAVASPQGEQATREAIAAQAPDATVETVTPQQAVAQRSGHTNPASNFVMLAPEDLKIDPERFQYKASDSKGVTGALQGVKKWEPALANPITAWQSADGETFVVNGHQRHDLATRATAAGQADVQIPTRIFREADGYTPEFMKALGAYQNIAEGSGTALDAAKVLRGKNAVPAAAMLPELPPKSQMVSQAQSLSKLSPDAFGMVENGVVPPEYAASVGELIADPKQQQAALGILAKADPANINQARLIVQDVRNSGFVQGVEQGLFGEEEFAQSLISERSKILDGAMQALRRTKGLYRAAVEGEEELTSAGNQLSTEANLKGKTENERLIDTLARDATNRGPISDALSEAARELAGGAPKARVQASFIAAVRRLVSRGEDQGLPDGAVHGGEGPAPGLEAGRRLPKPPGGGGDLFARPEDRGRISGPAPASQTEFEGMGRSARQAQAARDAAGPKSGQLPPNEGLFARPETPQAQLAKSRFDYAGGPTFKDLLHDVPDRMGGHKEATRWVAEQGKKTGHEYMAIVDNKTGEIIHAGTNGQKGVLSFDPTLNGEPVEPDAYTIHHNHPSSAALSGPDIGMLAWPGLSNVVAVAHNGDIFHARLAADLREARSAERPGFLKAFSGLSQTFERAFDKAMGTIQDLAWSRAIPLEEANLQVANLANHLLHEDGFIDYQSTRALPPEVIQALPDIMKETNAGNRPPVAVRADRGIAGLPAPSERGAEQGRSPDAGGGGKGSGIPPGERPNAPSPGGQGRLLEGPRLESGSNKSLIPPTPQFDVLRDKDGLRRAAMEIRSWFAPTSIKGAKPTERALRRHGAELAQSTAQSLEALKKVRDSIDHLPVASQEEFTHRMETGQAQPTPELQAVATALRDQLNLWAQKVRSLGPDYLPKVIDDYMGHVWGNYREWAKGEANPSASQMQAMGAAIGQSKTPLQGSGAFRKQRTFPTQRDGIAAGLVPMTYNPINLQMMKLREMQKFYHGVTLVNEMKKTHIARWIPTSQEGEARFAGLVQLDDRAFQPRLTGKANPAGFGRLEPGNYWAPEPAARLFNRYMGEGMGGQNSEVRQVFNTVRQAGNMLNQLQLSASGFHATFVTLDTMKSQVALGIQQLARGDVARGALNVTQGILPTSVVTTARLGGQVRAAWLDPQNATPRMQALADRINEASGRVSMDRFYGASPAGTFYDSLKDVWNHPLSPLREIKQMYRDTPGNPLTKVGKTAIDTLGRIIETTSHPLMGVLVPRAKLGVFARMAEDWQRNNPNATPEARADAMIKAWDSVDNRLGQMVYDNVFWNKALKDTAFISMRSVGWNLGTWRELGGAAADTASAARNIVKGRPAEFSHRMAYAMAMPIVTAIYGSILNYLATGTPPEDAKDLFFPRTGGTTERGEPQRWNIPGYEKDVYEMYHAPGQTLLNKMNPLVSMGTQMYQNEDYYGGIIYNPEVENHVQAYMNYMTNQILPFSARAMMRQAGDPNTTALDQIAAFWGLQPASKAITQPEIGERFQLRHDMQGLKRRNKEPVRLHPFSSQ